MQTEYKIKTIQYGEYEEIKVYHDALDFLDDLEIISEMWSYEILEIHEGKNLIPPSEIISLIQKISHSIYQ